MQVLAFRVAPLPRARTVSDAFCASTWSSLPSPRSEDILLAGCLGNPMKLEDLLVPISLALRVPPRNSLGHSTTERARKTRLQTDGRKDSLTERAVRERVSKDVQLELLVHASLQTLTAIVDAQVRHRSARAEMRVGPTPSSCAFDQTVGARGASQRARAVLRPRTCFGRHASPLPSPAHCANRESLLLLGWKRHWAHAIPSGSVPRPGPSSRRTRKGRFRVHRVRWAISGLGAGDRCACVPRRERGRDSGTRVHGSRTQGDGSRCGPRREPPA